MIKQTIILLLRLLQREKRCKTILTNKEYSVVTYYYGKIYYNEYPQGPNFAILNDDSTKKYKDKCKKCYPLSEKMK